MTVQTGPPGNRGRKTLYRGNSTNNIHAMEATDSSILGVDSKRMSQINEAVRILRGKG